MWSTDWIKNPVHEVERIEATLSRCRSGNSILELPISTLDSREADPAIEEESTAHVTFDFSVGSDGALPLFREYELVTGPFPIHGPELRYETENVLGELILKIVTAEGPIHQELVISRLRDLYGMDRAREPTRAHVLDVMGRLVRKGTFAFDRSFLYLQTQPVEPRRPTQNFRRSIDQISMRELAEGILAVSFLIQGASSIELITETARQFGFDRTGGDIQAALQVVLDALISTGELRIDEDSLVRPVRPVTTPRLSSEHVT